MIEQHKPALPRPSEEPARDLWPELPASSPPLLEGKFLQNVSCHLPHKVSGAQQETLCHKQKCILITPFKKQNGKENYVPVTHNNKITLQYIPLLKALLSF